MFYLFRYSEGNQQSNLAFTVWDTYGYVLYIYTTCWAWQPQTSNWGRSVTNAGFGQQLEIQPWYLDSQRGNKKSQSWGSFSLEVQYPICSIYGTVVTREKGNIMITQYFLYVSKDTMQKKTQQLITTTYYGQTCSFYWPTKMGRYHQLLYQRLGFGEWHFRKSTQFLQVWGSWRY